MKAARGAASEPVSVDYLQELARPELVKEWSLLFGTPPPPKFSQELMRQGIAWKLQVAAHGDISPVLARDLRALAEDHREVRPTKSGDALTPPLASSALKPGTRLVKAWRGDTYVVDIEEQGVRWNGELYGSLSAVAKAITGTHWNGLLFFGLRTRRPPKKRVAVSSQRKSPRIMQQRRRANG